MIRFSIEIEGEKQFDRAFNRVENHIEDLTPVWREVQREFFDIEQEQFSSQGAKGAHGKWAELSPAYEEIKLSKYGSIALIGGILYATGEMRESLTRNAKHTVAHFNKQEAAFGTDLPYPVFHQKGTSKMPMRKPIDFSDDQKRRTQKTIQKSLLKLIRGDREVRKTLVVTDGNFGDIG